MSASLLIDGPGMWAYNVELKKILETSIGRTRQNELVIPDPRVSSKHAKIFFDNDQWIFEDLGSSNGSTINGQRISGKRVLRPGDQIRLGSSELLFKNKDDKQQEATWDKTVMRLNQHELALREALKKAQDQERSQIAIPDLHIADDPSGFSGETLNPEGDSGDIISSGDMVSGMYKDQSDQALEELKEEKAKAESEKQKAEDMVWVAEQFADIVGHLARSGATSKTDAYSSALEKMREVLEMENGFLMVPNKEKRRWVIEAWIGNNEEWTSFEKKHPVPLTVANEAYKENHVVSNVWGEHRKALDSSASLLSLNVQTYVAVPLHKFGKKAGLIYMDQRRQFKPILDREVYLINKVGKYIVELEYST